MSAEVLTQVDEPEVRDAVDPADNIARYIYGSVYFILGDTSEEAVAVAQKAAGVTSYSLADKSTSAILEPRHVSRNPADSLNGISRCVAYEVEAENIRRALHAADIPFKEVHHLYR